MKFLCWVPILGVMFEGIHLSKYNRNYLADPMHAGRFFFSVLWHASSAWFIGWMIFSNM